MSDSLEADNPFNKGFDQFEYFVPGGIHSGAQEQMLLEPMDEISVSDLAAELSNGIPELGLIIEQLLNKDDSSPALMKSRGHTLRTLLARSRSFNIELYPRLVYSNGQAVDLLLASGVNNYLEFKALESAAVRWGGSIVNVRNGREEWSWDHFLDGPVFNRCPFQRRISSVTRP
jgi:hypothetical protein